MKGKVKMFNTARGFGFIAGEDGKDVYVHTSPLRAVPCSLQATPWSTRLNQANAACAQRESRKSNLDAAPVIPSSASARLRADSQAARPELAGANILKFGGAIAL